MIPLQAKVMSKYETIDKIKAIHIKPFFLTLYLFLLEYYVIYNLLRNRVVLGSMHFANIYNLAISLVQNKCYKIQAKSLEAIVMASNILLV